MQAIGDLNVGNGESTALERHLVGGSCADFSIVVYEAYSVGLLVSGLI